MYKPKFNHVLVEIDDKDAKWGKGTDDNIGGAVYREGKIVDAGECFMTADYPLPPDDLLVLFNTLTDGLCVMWNEGHEAGTVFEENGKKYALIYWWDIIGVKEEK